MPYQPLIVTLENIAFIDNSRN